MSDEPNLRLNFLDYIQHNANAELTSVGCIATFHLEKTKDTKNSKNMAISPKPWTGNTLIIFEKLTAVRAI